MTCSAAAPLLAAAANAGAHHAVDLPKDLVHLANLGLVLQEDGSVEVGDLQEEKEKAGQEQAGGAGRIRQAVRRPRVAVQATWGQGTHIAASSLLAASASRGLQSQQLAASSKRHASSDSTSSRRCCL